MPATAPAKARATRRLRALLVAIAAVAAVAQARPASALDFDRNDVMARDLAVLGVVGAFANHPVGLVVRGSARRHNDWFYRGLSLEVGFLSDVRPWLMLAGAIGAETATDSWAAFRAYAEGGVGLMYASTGLGQMLAFHVESGIRYQIRSYERPHVLVHVGARVLHNFNNYGLAVISGVAWTFD